MRPRAIQGVPGLDPNGTPFQRFERFARLIVAVPKTETEVENKINNSGSTKRGAGRKRK